MMLLWGEKDWCFTTKMRDQFRDIFPHAQSVGIRQAHHLLYEDEPEITLQAVKEFLA